MSRIDYNYADLSGKPALVNEIVQLESRLAAELGQAIALIAYAPVASVESERDDGNSGHARLHE